MAKFNLFGNLFGKGTVFSGDMVGRNIVINGKTITIDGKVVSDLAEGVIELKITEGVLERVESTANVTCGEVRGNIDAGMNVTCQNVQGAVEAGMTVNCGTVGGNVDAGMNVECGDVAGDVDAGMGVKITKGGK